MSADTDQQNTKTPKHVIFLGAGASATSGYPLAKDLRFLMSSSSALGREVNRLIKVVSTPEEEILNKADLWASRMKDALQLLREGCFGTVDEYCYLVRNARVTEVAQLKLVLRLILGVHQPENEAGEALSHPFVHSHASTQPSGSSPRYSDYYPFVQRLFEGDLHTLRKDIVVMSFNYDCYLEWLLRRAYRTRRRAKAFPKDSNIPSLPDATGIDASITSGFTGGAAGLNAIKDGDQFSLLKLHGLMAWPNPRRFDHPPLGPDCSFDLVFNPQIIKRLEALTAVDCMQSEVPIIFPWEMMEQNGTSVDKKEFPVKDAAIEVSGNWIRPSGRPATDPDPYEIFKAIWTRARDEVRAANKISFVGLSMHEYLNWGFQYLFKDRTGEIELVVTDKDSSPASRAALTLDQLDPLGAPARVANFLKDYCPEPKWNTGAPYPDREGTDMGDGGDPKPHRVKVVGSFEEFILREMG
ncbi:MAG: hypothetical protein A3G75_05525 [Verrucomicrobia bacterium RIFCSPLOWO2_12_FULL_64_8]|nr:MAG: hypothetical protein A3G75_05525 [Verrucomicrobia bacterium RIFCSPLOWO2_12_FULL_64_8]